MFLFWKKNIEPFHKYSPTVFSPAISRVFQIAVRSGGWGQGIRFE